MKRYLLFAGSHYYPFGGARDFIDSFDTLEEAMSAPVTDGREVDWLDIADLENNLALVMSKRGHRPWFLSAEDVV